ncbi:synaptotagmin-like protein 2 isoform X2 [Protopterus annectens]|uniref:synaptotagmin-like protein 2 isoform X2 n=1 Tax=Protopterus annectens TaxID=7888 RepID=UPI001CFBD353|nr:synaptotagmin-like protein 2 isoform X2 [Protopterus annectens]
MIDLTFLTPEEQEAIMKVLQRDADLKRAEEERVRSLQVKVKDETALKNMTGEWFYEAKSKRHREKVHGSDIIRASMKKKKPLTLFEMTQSRMKDKPSWANSIDRDVFVPPQLFGLIEEPEEEQADESTTPSVQLSNSVLQKPEEKVKQPSTSPAKQRRNPFNDSSLLDDGFSLESAIELEKNETAPIHRNAPPKDKVSFPKGSSSDVYLQNNGYQDPQQDTGYASDKSQRSLDEVPMPKPRTRVYKQPDSLLDSDTSVSKSINKPELNGGTRRGILKRSSSSSSNDSEVLRFSNHQDSQSRNIRSSSTARDQTNERKHDTQVDDISQNSADKLKHVRFSPAVVQKEPLPIEENYSADTAEDYDILSSGFEIEQINKLDGFQKYRKDDRLLDKDNVLSDTSAQSSDYSNEALPKPQNDRDIKIPDLPHTTESPASIGKLPPQVNTYDSDLDPSGTTTGGFIENSRDMGLNEELTNKKNSEVLSPDTTSEKSSSDLRSFYAADESRTVSNINSLDLQQGKPNTARTQKHDSSTKSDKYTFEFMRATDESISKVLDWFSRSEDGDDNMLEGSQIKTSQKPEREMGPNINKESDGLGIAVTTKQKLNASALKRPSASQGGIGWNEGLVPPTEHQNGEEKVVFQPTIETSLTPLPEKDSEEAEMEKYIRLVHQKTSDKAVEDNISTASEPPRRSKNIGEETGFMIAVSHNKKLKEDKMRKSTDPSKTETVFVSSLTSFWEQKINEPNAINMGTNVVSSDLFKGSDIPNLEAARGTYGDGDYVLAASSLNKSNLYPEEVEIPINWKESGKVDNIQQFSTWAPSLKDQEEKHMKDRRILQHGEDTVSKNVVSKHMQDRASTLLDNETSPDMGINQKTQSLHKEALPTGNLLMNQSEELSYAHQNVDLTHTEPWQGTTALEKGNLQQNLGFSGSETDNHYHPGLDVIIDEDITAPILKPKPPFKVTSLKEKMPNDPKDQIPSHSQFQMVRNFWDTGIKQKDTDTEETTHASEFTQEVDRSTQVEEKTAFTIQERLELLRSNQISPTEKKKQLNSKYFPKVLPSEVVVGQIKLKNWKETSTEEAPKENLRSSKEEVEEFIEKSSAPPEPEVSSFSLGLQKLIKEASEMPSTLFQKEDDNGIVRAKISPSDQRSYKTLMHSNSIPSQGYQSSETAEVKEVIEKEEVPQKSEESKFDLVWQKLHKEVSQTPSTFNVMPSKENIQPSHAEYQRFYERVQQRSRTSSTDYTRRESSEVEETVEKAVTPPKPEFSRFELGLQKLLRETSDTNVALSQTPDKAEQEVISNTSQFKYASHKREIQEVVEKTAAPSKPEFTGFELGLQKLIREASETSVLSSHVSDEEDTIPNTSQPKDTGAKVQVEEFIEKANVPLKPEFTAFDLGLQKLLNETHENLPVLSEGDEIHNSPEFIQQSPQNYKQLHSSHFVTSLQEPAKAHGETQNREDTLLRATMQDKRTTSDLQNQNAGNVSNPVQETMKLSEVSLFKKKDLEYKDIDTFCKETETMENPVPSREFANDSGSSAYSPDKPVSESDIYAKVVKTSTPVRSEFNVMEATTDHRSIPSPYDTEDVDIPRSAVSYPSNRNVSSYPDITQSSEQTVTIPREDLALSAEDEPSLPESQFNNPEKLKRLSKSVPAFLQEETDGRDTDSTSEGSYQLSKHKKTPSSLTNLSSSSGMASLSSVSGSVMSIYSGDFGNVDIKGTIQFTIDYVEQLKEFHIFIAQCRDLAAADVKKQRSDPYVKTYLLPDKAKMGKRKTSVKKKTLNPTYNEILRYKIDKETLLTQRLNVSVWHNDTFGRNSFLGEVDLDLATWNWVDQQMKWYPLKPRTPSAGVGLENRGEMKLALRYVPQPHQAGKKTPVTGEVHIWVKDCKNLPPLKSSGIDPFVKCSVLPDTSRKSRQKTRIVKKTTDPVFNHTMVYDGFRKEDLEEACVELTVWDHDRLVNHYLGGLRLGRGTGKSYGTPVDWMDSSPDEASLWERMMDSPNEWVEDVLPLKMLMMAKMTK